MIEKAKEEYSKKINPPQGDGGTYTDSILCAVIILQIVPEWCCRRHFSVRIREETAKQVLTFDS